MIDLLIEKLARGEKLSAGEAQEVKNWFERNREPISGAGSPSVSDRFSTLGTMVSGKFIAPSSSATEIEPTNTGFTGAAMGGDGWTFDGTVYNFVAVAAGILQAGFNTLGKLLAGAGDVILDEFGITIEDGGASPASQNKLKFGTTGSIYHLGASDPSLRVTNYGTTNGDVDILVGGGSQQASVSVHSDASVQYVKASPYMLLPEGSAPSTPASGNAAIYASTGSRVRVINDAGTDINLFAFPQTAMVFAQQFVFSATTGISQDSNQRFAFYRGPTAGNANNADTITASFVVAAGTYDLVIFGVKDSDCGITDGYLDGSASTSWTGDDWYNALGLSRNQSFTHSVTFATGGRHTVQLKVNGKNAGSSDYAVRLTDMYLVPASYTVEA